MSIRSVAYVTFYQGPDPAGTAIGAAASFQFDGASMVLPQVGTELAVIDDDGGTNRIGTVAEAGLVEATKRGGFTTFNIQINCINSKER